MRPCATGSRRSLRPTSCDFASDRSGLFPGLYALSSSEGRAGMTILKWIVTLTTGGYFAFLGFLYVAQRQFVFHPHSVHPLPAAAGLPEAEEAVVETDDGARVIIWHVPPR